MAVATLPETTSSELKGFDDFVEKLLRDWKVPGVSIAIVKGGEVVLCRGYGQRNVEADLPANEHTLMPIGSTSKTFTTAAMGLLADDGLLDWDTPVRQYLPTFKLWDQFASDRMTPRDLVCHRSGLPRHDLMWYGSSKSRADLFSKLQYLEPNADFRTVWQYQNLMFMTAGYLIEALSGMTWEEFVEKRILNTLGMVSTKMSSLAARGAVDLSVGYNKEKNKVVAMAPYEEFDAVAPAGSIVSSATDMSQWLLVHLNGGKHGDSHFLSEAQIRQMHAPQMVMPGGKWPELPHSSYGLGWFVQPYRGRNMAHHGGNIDGFSSHFAVMPEEGVGVVVLTNMNGTPVRDIIPYQVFDRFTREKPVNWNTRIKAEYKEFEAAESRGKEKTKADKTRGTRPSHKPEAFAGAYEHPGYGSLHILLQDGNLVAQFNNIDMKLRHYHYDTFQATYEKFGISMLASFTTDARGRINSVSVPLEPTVANIVFTRAADETMTNPSFLEQFTGSYDIMGNMLSVTIKGNVLQVAVPGLPEYELEPIAGTEFGLKGLTGFSIEFKHDESGKVSEAHVNQMGTLLIAKRR